MSKMTHTGLFLWSTQSFWWKWARIRSDYFVSLKRWSIDWFKERTIQTRKHGKTFMQMLYIRYCRFTSISSPRENLCEERLASVNCHVWQLTRVLCKVVLLCCALFTSVSGAGRRHIGDRDQDSVIVSCICLINLDFLQHKALGRQIFFDIFQAKLFK